jgi:hypothetical protein
MICFKAGFGLAARTLGWTLGIGYWTFVDNVHLSLISTSLRTLYMS